MVGGVGWWLGSPWTLGNVSVHCITSWVGWEAHPYLLLPCVNDCPQPGSEVGVSHTSEFLRRLPFLLTDKDVSSSAFPFPRRIPVLLGSPRLDPPRETVSPR